MIGSANPKSAFDPRSPLTGRLRRKLRKYGAAVIFDFMSRAEREALLREAEGMRARSVRYSQWYNPYNDARDLGPQTDATSFRSRFSVEVCDRSRFQEESAAYRLYRSPAMLGLTRSISGRPALSHYNDPGAALNLTYMREGDTIGWHFDTCDVVVALVLQAQLRGGELLFSCRNRSAYTSRAEHVFDVLTRPSVHCHRLPYGEGALIIFEGRHSIHCIKDIAGPLDRIVLLMSFHETDDTNVTKSLRRSRYRASYRRSKGS